MCSERMVGKNEATRKLAMMHLRYVTGPRLRLGGGSMSPASSTRISRGPRVERELLKTAAIY